MTRTIIIPRHFVKRISNNDYLDKTLTLNRLICQDKYIDVSYDTYISFMYRSSSSDHIPHYFGKNKHLYLNEVAHYKKKVNHIPHNHKHILINKNVYKLHKDSKISFIIETSSINNDSNVNNQKPSNTTMYISIPPEYDIRNIQNKDELHSLVSLFN